MKSMDGLSVWFSTVNIDVFRTRCWTDVQLYGIVFSSGTNYWVEFLIMKASKKAGFCRSPQHRRKGGKEAQLIEMPDREFLGQVAVVVDSE